MGEEEKNPNPICADAVAEILLRLPLKPILKFKTVSKQWKSILESKSFAERRKRVQKKPIILAVGDRDESRFEGDAEIDIVYLQRNDVTTRPSMTCDGLVCIPVPDWINVLNPSTGEFLRFPSCGIDLFTEEIWTINPEYWAMGFGRDQVKGSYKVVRLLFDFNNFEILDLHIGEWRKLSPPPYRIEATTIGKSACVNGSIYWLNLKHAYKILALDLHTQVFRDVPVLPPTLYSNAVQIVNLEDRLAIVDTREWVLEIWIMDAQGKRWTMTYSISLSHFPSSPDSWKWWFRPIALSKKGSLFLYGNENKLFEYHPETDFLRCLSPHIYVITPFIENLVPLGSCVPKISTSGHRYGLSYLQPACVPKINTSGHPSLISSVVGRIKSLIPNILLTSTLVSLIMFGYKHKFST